MKTKRSAGKPAQSEVRTPAEATKPAAKPANVEQSESASDPRVALVYYKDRDGKPDFVRMQERVKENFRAFFSDPDNRKGIGLVAAEPSKAAVSSDLFGQDEVEVFYNGLEFIDAVVASKLYGVPYELAAEAFTFDELQRRKLSGPTLRVINKWGPAILAKYKDEIGLGIILFSSVTAQTRKLKKLRREKSPEPANKVRSISEDKPATPAPRTTPEQPVASTASDSVDLETEIGFHIG